jgi:hypothetical protein
MRTSTLVLVFLPFALFGCDDDAGAPPSDLAGAQDQAVPDLLGNAGGDLGSEGATCNTACDCQPGLGCFNNQCTTGTAAVYCCSSSTCPSGAGCQDSTGMFQLCPSTPDGGGGVTDGGMVKMSDGGVSFCGLVGCSTATVNTCHAFGCTMCVVRDMGGGMVCGN